MALHRSSDYKDLSYLIGRELAYCGGLHFEFPPDGTIQILENYKNTVLVEFGWIYSDWWGCNRPERKRRILVSKAALACGDVKFRIKDINRPLMPDDISDLKHDSECIIEKEYYE